MPRVRLAAPADHEPLDDVARFVHLFLRDGRQAGPPRGLGHEGQGHHRGAGQVVAGLLVADVQERPHTPGGGEHRHRALHIDPDVTGVHRHRVRLGRGQAGGEGVVHQQPPYVAEGDMPDQILDVHAAVAEGAPFPVGLGDLRLKRDNAFETGPEVGHLPSSRLLVSDVTHSRARSGGRGGGWRTPLPDQFNLAGSTYW